MSNNIELVIEVSNKIHRFGTSPKVAQEFLVLINNLLHDNPTLVYSGELHRNEYIAQLIFWFSHNHKIWNHIRLTLKPEHSPDVAKYQVIFREAYRLNFTTWAKYDDILSLAKRINFEV